MGEIKDKGKVWIKGATGPVFAVRVDDKIFSTGKKPDQNEDLWIDNDGLCVDLHNIKKGERIARFIPLNTPRTLPGTLFNGFENTKHADVLIAAFDGEGAKEKFVSGEEYQKRGIRNLDRIAFWKTIWDF